MYDPFSKCLASSKEKVKNRRIGHLSRAKLKDYRWKQQVLERGVGRYFNYPRRRGVGGEKARWFVFLRSLCHIVITDDIQFQWFGLRGPMAERETTWSGHGDPWPLDLSRRMDPRIQGSLWCQTIDHVHCEIRGHVGEWSSRWLRFGDLRWQWWVQASFFSTQ